MTSSAVPAPVLVRFFAAAQASAGVAQTLVPWEQLDPEGTVSTLGVLQRRLLAASPTSASPHAPTLSVVFAQSSFLIGGRATKDQTTVLVPGAEVDILPPFAGG